MKVDEKVIVNLLYHWNLRGYVYVQNRSERSTLLCSVPKFKEV